jgi:hypothetical protein
VQFLATGSQFHGFHGVSYALLCAGGISLVIWLVAFGYRWWRTRPDLPEAGPEINEIPVNPESPAVANFLVNNWNVTPSAIAATLVDLSARRVLGLDLLGRDDTVVRLRDKPGSLKPYEEQVYKLVESRATGGSAPIEAISLGEEATAEAWTKKFRKSVVAEARSLGLARRRWEFIDYLIVGIGLAFVFGFFALALGTAHVAEHPGEDGSISPGDWLKGAAFAWFAAMALVTRSQDVTDTPAGRTACARWLGMRNYFRGSKAFENQPPASVTIWGELLAYGLATGTAREAARGLPIVAEPKDVAWSRATGVWRELRVTYPQRFGFGQRPVKVFFEGLGRTVFWGGIAFVVVPVGTTIAWQVFRDFLDNQDTTQKINPAAVNGIIIGVGAAVTVISLYLLARTFGGVARLVRGARDLNKTVALEGDVVKVYQGRFAVDDGKAESVVALMSPPLGQTVRRGQKVRATISPHLHHLSKLEVLKDVAPDPIEEPAAVSSPLGRIAFQAPVTAQVSLDSLVQVTGLKLRPSGASGGEEPFGEMPAQRFEDDAGNHLTIVFLPDFSAAGPLYSMMTKLASRQGEPVEGIGDTASWARQRALAVNSAHRNFIVDVDFHGMPESTRKDIASKVAGLVLQALPARSET